jgi:hypothetical protein
MEPLTGEEIAYLQTVIDAPPDNPLHLFSHEAAVRLMAEVRRQRAELLRRNIPVGGCQCACHGCQWCEC